MRNVDRNIPSVQGVGVVGYGQYTPFVNGKMTHHYRKWISMLERSLSPKYKQNNIEYMNVSCVEDWYHFQTFAEWCDNQVGFNNTGWHLDKDIIVKGNKVYGPLWCAFVPPEINTLINTRSRARSNTGVVGVLQTRYGRFAAACKTGGPHCEYLGTYLTIEEAFNAYKERKEQYIKQFVQQWRGAIDERVYHALMNYVVEMSD